MMSYAISNETFFSCLKIVAGSALGLRIPLRGGPSRASVTCPLVCLSVTIRVLFRQLLGRSINRAILQLFPHSGCKVYNYISRFALASSPPV